METKKTHREIKVPQMNARLLADFMAATDVSRGTILRKAKYQPLAPIVQHNEAKPVVANFIRSGSSDLAVLHDKAQALRDRLTDTDFDRLTCDYNADYIQAFIKTHPEIVLPKADVLQGKKGLVLDLNGVRVPVEANLRLRRMTKTNEQRTGLVAFRYAKSKPLSTSVGEWHAALLFGALNELGSDEGETPEAKLSVVIDIWTGAVHAAPGNAATRFTNAKAACTGIVERWPNIKPPSGAVL